MCEVLKYYFFLLVFLFIIIDVSVWVSLYAFWLISQDPEVNNQVSL